MTQVVNPWPLLPVVVTSGWIGPVHSRGSVAEAYRQSFGTLCEGTVDRLLRDTSGLRHLDVGSGCGTLAARAAALGRQVVAVDADPDMARLSATLVPGRVLEGALPDLPFDRGEFDVVTAKFVVNHVADPRAALRELARVARPGGHVAATIWPARGSTWGALVAEAFEVAGVLPGPSRRLSPELDFERSVAGLRGLADAAGLQVLEATQLNWTWTVSVDALWGGIAGGVATAGEQFLAQDPEVQGAVETAFRSSAERLADDGELRLQSTAVYVLASA